MFSFMSKKCKEPVKDVESGMVDSSNEASKDLPAVGQEEVRKTEPILIPRPSNAKILSRPESFSKSLEKITLDDASRTAFNSKSWNDPPALLVTSLNPSPSIGRKLTGRVAFPIDSTRATSSVPKIVLDPKGPPPIGGFVKGDPVVLPRSSPPVEMGVELLKKVMPPEGLFVPGALPETDNSE